MLAGYPVGWFAPTKKYYAEVWRDFEKLLAPITRSISKTDGRIDLVTGGSIEFWSLEDPDAGRSRKYRRIVVDEAAKARHLRQAWTEAIRATLTDFKGDADFYSTPKGRNFFWELFARGRDEKQTEWASWQMPTSTNPFIDPAEIEAARTELPQRVFEQEYLAVFQEESAGVFRGVAAAIDRGRTAADPPKPSVYYATGCDLARVDDFTVLSTFDPRGRQVHFDRFNTISWERQIESIKAVGLRYKGTVHMETNGVGDPIYERVRKLHVPVTPWQTTNSSKEQLIDNYAMAIEQGKVRLMDVPAQEDELLAFEYQMTPSRKVRMSAPEGMHDDTVIAGALGYWAADNPSRLRFA